MNMLRVEVTGTATFMTRRSNCEIYVCSLPKYKNKNKKNQTNIFSKIMNLGKLFF